MKSLVRGEGGVTVSMAGACQEINTEVDRKRKGEKKDTEKTCFKEIKRKKETTPSKECYALMSNKKQEEHHQSPTK